MELLYWNQTVRQKDTGQGEKRHEYIDFHPDRLFLIHYNHVVAIVTIP